jgi:hypothetical protein
MRDGTEVEADPYPVHDVIVLSAKDQKGLQARLAYFPHAPACGATRRRR